MSLCFSKSFIFVIVFVLLVPLCVLAHGTGESLEQEVDEYLVDIGYNSTEFTVNSPVVFEFGILEDGQPVDFSDVWVRIVQENKTIFASGIYNAEFGGARMTYVFPQEGSYEFSARFQNGNESIAEAIFPIEVLPSEDRGILPVGMVSLLVAGLIGAIASFLVFRFVK